jgi:uncharacterized protein YndB with AHSA1/START domain
MNLEHAPIAKAELLIRKPVAKVFEAFVNPAITTKFWFTKSSGPLEAGKRVRWDWEMFGVGTDVDVKTIEPNQRIVIDWGAVGKTSTVEWIFTARPDGTTFVSVTNSGFRGHGDELVQQALDSAGGFTLVLANLKALLEHGIDLNLIRDRFPEGH